MRHLVYIDDIFKDGKGYKKIYFCFSDKTTPDKRCFKTFKYLFVIHGVLNRQFHYFDVLGTYFRQQLERHLRN